MERGEESDENHRATASSDISAGRPKNETDDDAKLKRREENARYYEKNEAVYTATEAKSRADGQEH